MFDRLKGANDSEVEVFGAKELARDGSDMRSGHLAQVILDLIGPENVAVAKPLFSDPVHLVIGAFLAEVDLPVHVIASAAHNFPGPFISSKSFFAFGRRVRIDSIPFNGIAARSSTASAMSAS